MRVRQPKGVRCAGSQSDHGRLHPTEKARWCCHCNAWRLTLPNGKMRTHEYREPLVARMSNHDGLSL